MKFRILIAGITLFVLSSVNYAQAQAQDFVDKFSDLSLLQIIKDDGYSAVEKADDGVFKIKIDGKSYLLLNNDDGDLQMYYGESGRKIGTDGINKWNKDKRLSRAYIDKDGDPVIEADLLSNGGMNEKRVTEFVRIYLQSVRQFVSFLDDFDKAN